MEELYHAALEKSGEEREALLANSDPEVRRSVEALLAQGTSGERVLDYPAWEQAATSQLVPPAAQIARGDEAVAEAKRGLQTDPLSTGLNGNLGFVFVFTHQWDKAIEQLRTSIDLDPNYWFDHYFLGRAYEQKARLPEAIASFKRGISLEGTTEVWSSLGHVYAVSGKREEAQKVIDHLNLAPQCIAGHKHERTIKPAIDLGREHRFGLAGPVGNTWPRVGRFAAYAMTSHQTDSFASPSSTRCSSFGGVPGCHSLARCDTR
jgi:tetratricopeptide (TPR) repeat protein